MVAWTSYDGGSSYEADLGPFLGDWGLIVPRSLPTTEDGWFIGFIAGGIPDDWDGTSSLFDAIRFWGSGHPAAESYRERFSGEEDCDTFINRWSSTIWNPPGSHFVVQVYTPDSTEPSFTPESLVPTDYAALAAATAVRKPKGDNYNTRIKACGSSGQKTADWTDASFSSDAFGVTGDDYNWTYFGNNLWFEWTAPAVAAGDRVVFTVLCPDGGSNQQVGFEVLEGDSYATLDFSSADYGSMNDPFAGGYLDFTPGVRYIILIDGMAQGGVAWQIGHSQDNTDYVTDSPITFPWTTSYATTGDAIWANYGYTQDFPDHSAGYHPWLHQDIIDCCWAHTVVGNSGNYVGSINTCPAIGDVALSNTFSGSGGFAVGEVLDWSQDDFFGDSLGTTVWMAAATYELDAIGPSARTYMRNNIDPGPDPVTGSTEVEWAPAGSGLGSIPTFASGTLTPAFDDLTQNHALRAMNVSLRLLQRDSVEYLDESARWIPTAGSEIANIEITEGGFSCTPSTIPITRADVFIGDDPTHGGYQEALLTLLARPDTMFGPAMSPADASVGSGHEYSGGNFLIAAMLDPDVILRIANYRYGTVIAERPPLYNPTQPDTICDTLKGLRGDNGQRWY